VLAAAFNRGSLDVPSGLFTPRTTFSLNNRSYESILGGSPEDPLIHLLARGAAGYRAAAKALQYALQRPVIRVESVSKPDASGVFSASIFVEGQLRDSGEPFSGRASLWLTCDGVELTSVEVSCSVEDLARIAASRLT
jgi:hypothetical protein